MATTLTPAIGASLDRVDGREKVTGQAVYAFEHQVEGVVYVSPVGAGIAAGEVSRVDAAAALRTPGVLEVVTHENALALQPVQDGELAVLQSPRIAYRGQIVAAVVAETLEIAREAAERVIVGYDQRPHDVRLRDDHPGLYKPDVVVPSYPTDTAVGEFERAFSAAEVQVDRTYVTPAFHNNPMEPHASLAVWENGDLTLYDSAQGANPAQGVIAEVFDLPPERVRIISPHVGGGFGSKGSPRPQAVLAAMAARMVERPVKVALTRQQMFPLTGYRTPTIQRLRLGASPDGRIDAIAHDVWEQTSTVKEFAEQTATPTRVMYAGPNRRTSHRLVALDVPSPSWLRAPGETPGMYALESAMDELAIACRVDPVELRILNDPETDPENGLAFSSRNLVACLREGAARFGWADRDPTPGTRRQGAWLIGTGVASSTYPAYRAPAQATARAEPGGGFLVRVGGADIGTGARTVMTQIAADTLGVAPSEIRVELGDSSLPPGPVAGGSMGTASWGSAVVRACEALREQLEGLDETPADGLEGSGDTAEDLENQEQLSRHAFGAQFVEVRVNAETGEVRIPRMVGVFAAGRIINPKTARSQFIGGMTMGMSMALFEQSVMDVEFGDFLNHDLAQYHVAACADVPDIEVAWIDEEDHQLNPMGSKGIGEIGIVGTAAAVGNAVHHATGVRLRGLPIQVDQLVG